MPEVGYVSRMSTKLAALRAFVRESAAGASLQPRPSVETAIPSQARLPLENAVREMIRTVTDYILSSRLTHEDAYNGYTVELIADVPLAQSSGDELDLIEELSVALLNKVALNPFDISTTELDLSGTFLIGRNLITVNPSDTLEQIVYKTNQGAVSPSVPSDMPQAQGDAAAGLVAAPTPESGQKFVMSWTFNALGTLRASTSEEPALGTFSAMPGPQSAMPGPQSPTPAALPFTLLSAPGRGYAEKTPETLGGVPIINSPMPGQQPVLSTYPGAPATTANVSFQVAASTDAAVSEAATGASVRVSSPTPEESSPSSEVIRVNLKGFGGGHLAEMRIRYDDAAIMSKAAILSEHVNAMLRLCDEQAKSGSASRQKLLPGISLSLRQTLAAALSVVVENNRVFVSPASLGITLGRDGLLYLDTSVLRGALQSNRDETAAVIRSFVNSFYDHISLYMDPRVLAGLAATPDAREPEQVSRSRRKAERRWQKEKERLEKSSRELALVLEDSGRLRDWFMQMVEAESPLSEEPQPEDEVVKRNLPAVDLPWDQEEVLTEHVAAALEKAPIEVFMGLTRRALKEENIDDCIRLLLDRKVVSSALLAEKPRLDLKDAMVCLANEELILGRLEAERRNVFEGLEELSRNMVVTRGYRSKFPFPPPMAAFITSEG